ncbi:MAG: cycloeucalenol cycloisomerase [Bermanella sp.]|jgi:cycloeucalenol cycloisomerase
MTMRGHWFSTNPDKAWGEKYFLAYIPVFFAYNAAMQMTGWMDAGNFWHITQNLLMWFPFCVLLPWFLRRNSGITWYQSYWFKFNLYMTVFIFFCTYFHTEYFFDVLGLRYRFNDVSLYFDSALIGPDEASALAQHKKVPLGMYLNSIAFFIVYHSAAVVVMRRIRSMTHSWARMLKVVSWCAIVAATALFFAWAETYFYITDDAAANVWYVDLERMLKWGSIYYAMYFIVSFPNVFRLDEQGRDWTLGRTVMEACAVSAISLLLLDLWALLLGPVVV